LLDLDVDELAAPYGAIGADRARHPVGGLGAGPEGLAAWGADGVAQGREVAVADLPQHRPPRQGIEQAHSSPPRPKTSAGAMLIPKGVERQRPVPAVPPAIPMRGRCERLGRVRSSPGCRPPEGTISGTGESRGCRWRIVPSH